jgi:oligoribonuclease
MKEMEIMEFDSILWIDIETTGLDPKEHEIIEICATLTEWNLNLETTFTHHIDPFFYENITPEALAIHEKSGLWDLVKESNYTTYQVENQILRWCEMMNIPKATYPVAGNSVAFDRLFIAEKMPRFNEYLGKVTIDVSGFSEIAKRFYPEVYESKPTKEYVHRAEPDVSESIKEFMHYKNNMFR